MGKRLRFMTGLTAPLQVEPGSEVRLSRDRDPGCTGGVARPAWPGSRPPLWSPA